MLVNETVIFDLEDTLVQTPWSDHQHVAEFRKATRQKLTDLGIPASVLSGTERSTLMRNQASEYVEHNFGRKEAENFRREMEKFLSTYEQDSARKSKLFPDTIPTLDNLTRLGAKMGLVTNTSADAVQTVLRVHKLERYFTVAVTRENVARLKPDPEGLLIALKRLGAKRFFMVGDLILDMLAAKSANGVAVLIRRTGQSNTQNLFKSLPANVLAEIEKSDRTVEISEADYIIESLTEVPRIILTERAARLP